MTRARLPVHAGTWATACVALWLALGCKRAEPGERQRRESASVAPPVPAIVENSAVAPRIAYPFQALGRCRVDHGGLFVDLGSDTSQLRRSYALGPFNDVVSEVWGEQSHARFSAPDVTYDFWLREPKQGLQVRVRARGGSAASLSASVDQQRLGSVRLRPDGFATLSFPVLDSVLAPGRHQLRLRWSGRGTGDSRSFGLAEWIHTARPKLRETPGPRPLQRSRS